MRGPTCICWANLTPLPLEAALELIEDSSFDSALQHLMGVPANKSYKGIVPEQVRKTPSWARSWANSSVF
jgi:hypothetical protein